MKVVLIQKADGIGEKGDEKEIKPGFARNFLFPRGLAVPVESEMGKKILAEIKNVRKEKEDKENKINELLANHQNIKIVFTRKTRGKKLFASVKMADIISSIEKIVGLKPISILPKNPIKEIGEYKIEAQFSGKRKSDVTIEIAAEK